MKKIPSWKLNESFKKFNNRYDRILATATRYTNTLNENDMSQAVTLIEQARELGWYPFVSDVYTNTLLVSEYEAVASIKKDEIIFEVLMLESEIDILSEFSDFDVTQMKSEIKKIKGLL